MTDCQGLFNNVEYPVYFIYDIFMKHDFVQKKYTIGVIAGFNFKITKFTKDIYYEEPCPVSSEAQWVCYYWFPEE